MKRMTFAELAAADMRTQRFTPYGLSTGTRILTPESCADFQQASVATAELSKVVPESTRTGFDRLRLFHGYGVLCYELFTLTDDLTWIVLEQALRHALSRTTKARFNQRPAGNSVNLAGG